MGRGGVVEKYHKIGYSCINRVDECLMDWMHREIYKMENGAFLKACGSAGIDAHDLYSVFHAFGLDTLLIGNDMESRDNETWAREKIGQIRRSTSLKVPSTLQSGRDGQAFISAEFKICQLGWTAA